MCKQYRPDFGQCSFEDHLWGVSLFECASSCVKGSFSGVTLDCECIPSFARQWLWVELSLEPQKCKSALHQEMLWLRSSSMSLSLFPFLSSIQGCGREGVPALCCQHPQAQLLSGQWWALPCPCPSALHRQPAKDWVCTWLPSHLLQKPTVCA